MAAPKKTAITAPDSPSPRSAILAAAQATIDSAGESAVRITEVARQAGVTQGMVSYYFKDREGLIVEAQLASYRAAVDQDAGLLLQGVKKFNTVDEFHDFVKLATRELTKISRLSNRISRVVVLGAAANRPDLKARVLEVQEKLINDLEEVAAIAQEKGFFRTDLSARAIGSFVASYTLGLIVADLDSQRPTDEQLAQVIDALMSGLRPPNS
jgi:AcrR family transcriptional regulator